MTWRSLFHLCWFFGHRGRQIVDYDARRVFNRCVNCGHEWQFDFQASLGPDWIGFCDEPHRCPLCMGWKPAGWDRCGNEVCGLNPNGPLHLTPDGSAGHRLDTRDVSTATIEMQPDKVIHAVDSYDDDMGRGWALCGAPIRPSDVGPSFDRPLTCAACEAALRE